MEKEEKRKYIFAQLNSLPNAFQYMEVTQYIKDLETQLKKQKEIIDRLKELNLTISDSDYVYSQDEITSKNLELLQMLEDKEVQE